jgi:hypothetical protein
MLDPKEEARFDELKSKCRELKVPAPPEIMIGLKVHEGGVLIFDDTQRAHSWTRAYWNQMTFNNVFDQTVGSTWGAGSLATKIYTGAISSSYTSGASEGHFYRIAVGTSDTAFSVLDYVMGADIASGNGSGQLLASGLTSTTPTYDAGTHVWSNTFSTIYNNNSGSSITVKETGLISTSVSVLLERSVLSPTVAVANGAQLTVTYSISMDFSAID